ncbi:MAG TPA: tRNA (adenosine(37)-N6)-dimethylallyltransferase MiaA [Steroidobacteraceae bacterium]|nr:tRNA (adenosine(37)-N6)-dimethylallyltransferase MiaA [Steroidobacteraceae bacterium]
MAAVAPGERLPLLVLTGPTGSGKTAWALALAQEAPVEVVSVDSALVYRGLDIGTAKPDPGVRARIPHHRIDGCDAAERYSAGQFVREARAAIGQIHARGRVPLLVGGTMLYLKALFTGLARLPAARPELRRELDERARRLGWPALHAELAALDPQAAARIAPADAQRIQRALEVCLTTGEPISRLQRATVSPFQGWPVRRWVLAPGDRSALHARLAVRFEGMMAAGFLEEVRSLRARAELTAEHPSMRSVGYRQLWAHLDGACELGEAVGRGIAATRQLAKRQLTWMRSEASGQWIDPLHTQPLSWIRDTRAWLADFGL